MRNCWDQATHQQPSATVWRAPEGPEGQGGLRGAAPNKVRSPNLAGGRALRRPEHPRSHKHPGPVTAGGPPPTGTQSSPAQQDTQSSPAQQAAGYAKGAGIAVPAPCRLTQPLPRRGSGRMILSPGDGDASTGTCRPRRPLPGPLRRSGRRSRCAQGAGPGRCSAWWPGRRARRSRSSRR